MKYREKIIAHRGLSVEYPENTRIAFDKAFERGCPGVEMDVHLTKDDQLVVIHDEWTTRTSDLELMIKDSTLEELREANFSHGFRTPKVLGEFPKVSKPEPETIMTLKEFLDEYADKFEVISIEVKNETVPYPDIERKTLEVAEQYKDRVKIIYASLEFETIKKIRLLAPEVEIAWHVYLEEQYSNLSNERMEEIRFVCTYISIWDEFFFIDRDNLDILGLPYITWEWRDDSESKETLNGKVLPYRKASSYTKEDREAYFKCLEDDRVKYHLANYIWE